MAIDVYGAGALRPSYENQLLNPSFETVLFGTHTDAIMKNSTLNTSKNSQFPGWCMFCPNDTDAWVKVERETSNITRPGRYGAKLTCAFGSSHTKIDFMQDWQSSLYLDSFVDRCLGKYVTFALDVKLGTAKADAVRLQIYRDGTGGGDVYSAYHGNNTDFERLLVSAYIPTDATRIFFSVNLEYNDAASPTYYIDNGMVVMSEAAFKALPFVPRLPRRLLREIDGSTIIFEHHNADNDYGYYSCDSANWSTHWSPNAVRPPWANHVMLKQYARGTAITDILALFMKPKGFTEPTYSFYTSAYAANATCGDGTVIQQLGQDSLYDLFILKKYFVDHLVGGWIGEDL